MARLDPCLSVGNTRRPVETKYLSYDSFVAVTVQLTSIKSVEEYTEENSWKSMVEQ